MFISDMVQVKTDPKGKFTFEHVIPGHVAAMREIVVQHGQFWTNTPCYGVLVDLAPGETGKVVIGGTGRPVIGHVEMPLFEGKKFDWSASDAIEVGPERNQNFGRAEGEWYTKRFCAAIGRDGSFRVDDIPPGDYTFTLRINKPGTNPGNPMGQQMGIASTKFTVPEFEGGATRNAEPLDLGELKPQINVPAGGAR